MHDLILLAIQLLVTLAKFLRPGGIRAVAAKSLALKHQLLICNRSRQRTVRRLQEWRVQCKNDTPEPKADL
jgi:hypothetical protein